MPKKSDEGFTGGGFLFIIGLVALTQGHVDATILLCGMGIVMMAASDSERMKQLWDLFFNGFVKILRLVFSIFRK